MVNQSKRWLHKVQASSMLGSFFIFSLLTPCLLLAQEDYPSRAIYVVYDDSGSMYVDNEGNMVDTWSKAKYSMEVFASMLGEDDSMAVYYMSDYSKDGKKEGPKIEIEGSDSTQINVQKIHTQRTASGYTPFETVEAAYTDLEKDEAEEKWLVILTDGDFQKNDEALADKTQVTQFMDDFFENKDPNVNVAFLAIGENVIPLTENKGENIFFEKAVDSSQILEKVTEISNRIFNMNRLNLSNTDGQFEIDVPMAQLTVFVQGVNAKILALRDGQGNEVGTLNEVVSVKATEESDNDLHQDNLPDSSLNGELATFTGNFAPGSYQVQAQNAQNIEVYYKPNLDVVAYLTTPSNEKITDLTDLPTGEYVIHFELVSGIDHSPLPQRNIINQASEGIQYQAQVTNNGKTLESTFQDGDNIHVEQGDLEIEVTATYLKYNTSTTHLSYSIWSHKNISFETIKDGPWILDHHLDPSKPFQVQLLVEGIAPSALEWDQIGIPTIQVLSKPSLASPILVKETTPGLYSIVPNETQSDFEGETYSQAKFLLEFEEEVDQIPWRGSQEVEVNIEDKRNWFIRHEKWLKEHWGVCLIGFILLGCLIGEFPPLKKWLPKLPSTPLIERKPKNGLAKKKASGTTIRTLNLIPFSAQTGTIQVVPDGVKSPSIPELKVKAGKNKSLILTNPQDFENIKMKIGGRLLQDFLLAEMTEKEKKNAVQFWPSDPIVVEGKYDTFVCHLEESYE